MGTRVWGLVSKGLGYRTPLSKLDEALNPTELNPYSNPGSLEAK